MKDKILSMSELHAINSSMSAEGADVSKVLGALTDETRRAVLNFGTTNYSPNIPVKPSQSRDKVGENIQYLQLPQMPKEEKKHLDDLDYLNLDFKKAA